MAWPKPPLAPVTRMERFLGLVGGFMADEMSADGLLVAADDTDGGGSEFIAGERVESGGALPGAGGGQSFAQNGFKRETRSGPIGPGAVLGLIGFGMAEGAVAEQMNRGASGQLGADTKSGLGSRLVIREKMRVSDGVEFDGQAWGGIALKAEGGSAFTNDSVGCKQLKSVGGEPIHFLGADDEALIDLVVREPLSSEGEANEKSSGVANERVIEGGGTQDSGHVAGGSIKDSFREDERAGSGWVLDGFGVKTAGIIDAAGHHTQDNAKPVGWLRSRAEGLQSGADGELRDGAGPTETGMGESWRLGIQGGHTADESLDWAGMLDGGRRD